MKFVRVIVTLIPTPTLIPTLTLTQDMKFYEICFSLLDMDSDGEVSYDMDPDPYRDPELDGDVSYGL